jgi:1-deoxyxylulose-5-phosphate synthase
MWTWQFARLQHAAFTSGARFVSMQNQYGLMMREDEREMFPLLQDQGVGSIPWSPLAKGRLARPFGAQTNRGANDPVGRNFFGDGEKPVIDAVQTIAERRGIPMAQVALAWVLRNPQWSPPSSVRPIHATSATRSKRSNLSSTTAKVDALETHYTLREPAGFQ